MARDGSDDESSSTDVDDDLGSRKYGTSGPSRAIYEAGMHRLQERWSGSDFGISSGKHTRCRFYKVSDRRNHLKERP